MSKTTLIIFLLTGLCAPCLATAAITAPYANDFSASASAFAATSSSEWTLGLGVYQNTVPNNATSTATLEFSNLGGANLNDFLIATTFTITNSTSSVNSLGFLALGESPDATDTSKKYYLADVFADGRLRLQQMGFPNPLLNIESPGVPALAANVPYLLELDGAYNQVGDLLLSLSLTGNSVNRTISFPIPAADVLAGNYFGYRNRATGGNANDNLTLQFDSVNVTAIPEPTAIGFVVTSLITGFALGTYWRRRLANLCA